MSDPVTEGYEILPPEFKYFGSRCVGQEAIERRRPAVAACAEGSCWINAAGIGAPPGRPRVDCADRPRLQAVAKGEG